MELERYPSIAEPSSIETRIIEYIPGEEANSLTINFMYRSKGIIQVEENPGILTSTADDLRKQILMLGMALKHENN